MISDSPRQPRKSIGEEFIEWAEANWRLDKVNFPSPLEGETFPYSSLKNAFIWKINELISERIGPLSKL